MTEGRCRAPRWHVTCFCCCCCMGSERTTPSDLLARVGVNSEIAIGLMAEINFVSN